MSCKLKVQLLLLQEAIRKHAEVKSRGGEVVEIIKEGVGVATGRVAAGGGGVKRVSSEVERGGKRSLTALGRVDAMYQNVVKYGALDEHQVTFETDLAVLVSKETSLPLLVVTGNSFLPNLPCTKLSVFRTLCFRRDPHVYMGQQFDNLESTFLSEIYIKRISSNHVACLGVQPTFAFAEIQTNEE